MRDFCRVFIIVGLVGFGAFLTVLTIVKIIDAEQMVLTARPGATIHVAADMTSCPGVARVALDASTSGATHMLGAVGVPQLRLLNELRACTGAATALGPNPRHVSNVVFSQATTTPPSPLTALAWSFGQFVDHDIVLTRVRDGTSACPAMSIDTTGDAAFGARGPITVAPSVLHASADGTYHTIAGITNFVDASNVYGSDAGRAYHLRAFAHGLLRTSRLDPRHADDETLPNNTVGVENVGGDMNTAMFLAGDIRSSEQAPLSAWHTLWLREHNFQARRLASAGANDECVFQAARAVVVAELQRAVFDEFMPALLGGPLAPYTGFNATIDPRVSVEFSGAAYRFGHSMVNDVIFRAHPVTGAPLPSVPLRSAFKRPDALLRDAGIDELFAGGVQNRSERVDARVVDALRQHLFESDGVPQDLVSINIERGRELNLSSIATVRAHFANNWPLYATREVDDNELLLSLYGTHGIDLYVGLLAEAPANSDGVLGRTLEAMVRDQFTRLRDGDPQYYRAINNNVVSAYVDSDAGTLRAIIARNTRVASSVLPAGNIFIAT